jgi:hypothetical protein
MDVSEDSRAVHFEFSTLVVWPAWSLNPLHLLEFNCPTEVESVKENAADFSEADFPL